jgi:hypothetical protein
LLILALAAFLVLGLFLWTLSNAAEGDKQACKLSVLSRGSLPEGGKEAVPLSCTTEKICLTSDKGKCAETMAGETITTIKLPKDPVDAARTIEATAAEAMYSCWDMMGKGQVDIYKGYLDSRGFNRASPACIICSRIALDRGVSEQVVSKTDFAEYIRTTKVPGTSKTYLQTMSDSDVNAFPAISSSASFTPPEDVSSFTPAGAQIAIVFMQIHTTTWTEAMKRVGSDLFVGSVAGLGGSFYISTASTLRNTGAVIQFVARHLKVSALVGAAVVGGTITTQYFVTRASASLAAGYCGDLKSSQGSKYEKGCSIVQAVPYNAQAINQLCGGNVEGAP